MYEKDPRLLFWDRWTDLLAWLGGGGVFAWLASHLTQSIERPIVSLLAAWVLPRQAGGQT